jgi:hypothetical protein
MFWLLLLHTPYALLLCFSVVEQNKFEGTPSISESMLEVLVPCCSRCACKIESVAMVLCSGLPC